MTIVAVAGGKIYVDSLQSVGMLRQTVSKVVRRKRGTYTCSGAANYGDVVTDAFEKFNGDVEDFECGTEDPEGCTQLYVRLSDRRIFTLRVVQGARWELLPDAPVSYVSGAGAEFFLAYFAIHKDAELAAKLTAIHNQYCGLPIEQF